VDCVWNPWTDWTNCSVSCANGTQSRSRTNIPAKYSGAACSGPANQVQNCKMDPCPINCVWGNWIEIPCTATCGTGRFTKTRSIAVVPNWGGNVCSGTDIIIQNCSEFPCPVDCVWKAWSDWSACSVTCANGTQTRTRGSVPAQFGGRECVGAVTQTIGCKFQPCPIACVWSNWTYSACPVTCGGGHLTKYREVARNPDWGGAVCEGPTVLFELCNPKVCPTVYAQIWVILILVMLFLFVLLSIIMLIYIIYQKRIIRSDRIIPMHSINNVHLFDRP